MAVRRQKKTAKESRLFDRELSWLEWNARVLELAGDKQVPLLERLRFTAIFSSNLDEFCMVRVAELLEAVRTLPNRPRTAGELLPSEVLDRVGTRMRELVERQSAMLAELLAELRATGIAIMPVSEVIPSERGELAATFHGSIFPVLTPLAVGPGRPFPYISNLSLSLGVMLRDPETGQRRLARVKVPEVLPRFLPIGDDGDRFVALEDLIATHLDSLFPGMEIEEHAAFRVTRDADFEIEEAADDLLSAVERELGKDGVKDARLGPPRPVATTVTHTWPASRSSTVAPKMMFVSSVAARRTTSAASLTSSRVRSSPPAIDRRIPRAPTISVAAGSVRSTRSAASRARPPVASE